MREKKIKGQLNPVEYYVFNPVVNLNNVLIVSGELLSIEEDDVDNYLLPILLKYQKQFSELLIPSSNNCRIVVSVNNSRLLYFGKREVKNSPILSLGILRVTGPYFISNLL